MELCSALRTHPLSLITQTIPPSRNSPQTHRTERGVALFAKHIVSAILKLVLRPLVDADLLVLQFAQPRQVRLNRSLSIGDVPAQLFLHPLDDALQLGGLSAVGFGNDNVLVFAVDQR